MSMRYAEDYLPGSIFDLGEATLSEAEIIAFAQQWDPQPFHINPEAAKASMFGGIIASGWQTALVMMRLLIDRGFLSMETSLGSPGHEELRWLQPVRPGQVLRGEAEVHGVKFSKSRPELGFVDTTARFRNAAGEEVYRLRSTAIIKRRPA
jgi:acyl dehydratase